jgi:hypothetical protein
MADPNINEWVTYIGMAVGGAIAAFVVRMGWRKGPPTPEQSLVVSGQAQITDMSPIRDLLKQVDLLCVKLMAATASVDGMAAQQTRVALAIEALAAEVRQHLEAVRAEMEESDRKEEIDRESDRKARILAEDMVRRREDELAAERRPPRKTT